MIAAGTGTSVLVSVTTTPEKSVPTSNPGTAPAESATLPVMFPDETRSVTDAALTAPEEIEMLISCSGS